MVAALFRCECSPANVYLRMFACELQSRVKEVTGSCETGSCEKVKKSTG
jgi:hypothetical protein